MHKISSQDAASLLMQAGATIRNLKEERNDLLAKVASFEKKGRMEKIARDMEEKGLAGDLSFEEKLATLDKAPNLDVTEEAVKLAAPQGRGFGSLSDQPTNSVSSFEHFIMTGEDPSEGS